MDEFYALLKERASRMRLDDFVSWLKQPVMLFDVVTEQGEPTIAPSTLAIESTVLLQQSHEDPEGSDEPGMTQRLARRVEKGDYTLGDEGKISIGRSEDCDLVIDHHSISKVHAFLVRGTDGSYQIVDAGSRNGVMVNGRRVSTELAVRLRGDDVIRVGSVLGRLVFPRPLHGLLLDQKPTDTIWRRLRDRTFAAFWAGQGFAFLADSLYRMVLTWWVMTTTGSGAAISALAVFTIVPMLLTLLGGGFIVDRMPRSRVLLLSIAMRATTATTIAIAESTGHLATHHLFLGATIFGIGDALFLPAYAAIVPDIVRRDDLPAANALNTFAVYGANIGGPALGALFAALGVRGFGFAAVAVLFWLASICFARLPANVVSPSPRGKRSFGGSIGEAARVMIADRWLWVTSLTVAICSSIGFAAAAVVMPILIQKSLHLDMSYFGIAQATFSVGALIGSLAMGKLPKAAHRGRLAYTLAACIGLSIVIASLPVTIYGVLGAWFVRGVAASAVGLIWIGTIQQLVPRDMLGRVASIDGFLSMAMLISSFVGAGWLTQHARPEVVLLIGGVLAMAWPLVALIHPRIRNFE